MAVTRESEPDCKEHRPSWTEMSWAVCFTISISCEVLTRIWVRVEVGESRLSVKQLHLLNRFESYSTHQDFLKIDGGLESQVAPPAKARHWF